MAKPLTFEISDEPVSQNARLKINMPREAEIKFMEHGILAHIKEYSQWLFDYLGIANISSHLCPTVTLNFVIGRENTEDKTTWGTAHNSGWETSIHIFLENLRTIGNLLVTLAHEFIHIKQYHYGELVGREWHGMHYEPLAFKNMDSKRAQYRNSPWEREAWHNADTLAYAWQWRQRFIGKDIFEYSKKF